MLSYSLGLAKFCTCTNNNWGVKYNQGLTEDIWFGVNNHICHDSVPTLLNYHTSPGVVTKLGSMRFPGNCKKVKSEEFFLKWNSQGFAQNLNFYSKEWPTLVEFQLIKLNWYSLIWILNVLVSVFHHYPTKKLTVTSSKVLWWSEYVIHDYKS